MTGHGGERSDDLARLRGPFAGTESHLDAPYAQTSSVIVEAMLDLAEMAKAWVAKALKAVGHSS